MVLKSYRGGEPCQRFGIVEHEHPGCSCHHFPKQVVEKVLFEDVLDLWVLIKIDLRGII